MLERNRPTGSLYALLLRKCMLPLLWLLALPAFASFSEFNVTEGVTTISRSIYELHMLVFWICCGIAVIVYGVMAYTLFAFRKSQGAKPASFHDHTALEWSWTLLAGLVLVVMAIPSTITLAKIYDTRPGDINITVTGYQWKWRYHYAEADVSFFSSLLTPEDEYRNKTAKGQFYLVDVDEPITVPEGTKVRFLITSNDVIHSFWLPDLGIKQDAIPGYFNTAVAELPELSAQERSGDGLILRGVCAELCGRLHGFMPIVMNIVSRDKYDSWVLAKQTEAADRAKLTTKEWTAEELRIQGEAVYNKTCAVCHQSNGQGLVPTFPALAGSEKVLGDVNITIDAVVNGVEGTAMAAFSAQLDPIELAGAITYIRSSWGNDAQGFVTPQTILHKMNQN